jgi:hypothetical protein
MTTKRELLAMLEPFSDDMIVEIGLMNSESGTQHEITRVVYATGFGRCRDGQSCAIIEYDPSTIDPPDDLLQKPLSDLTLEELCEEDNLVCPHCAFVLSTCPSCGEEL